MFPFPHISHRLTPTPIALLCAFASLVVAAFCAAPAGAAVSTAECSNEGPLSQPFLKWGDTNEYALVPGGNFEGSPTGWTLSGGAARVAGGDPYTGGGAQGWSLTLPAGASAQSPSVCVNAEYPTFRLFARNHGAASTFVAQVVYQTARGPIDVPVGTVAPGSEWQPTAAMLTGGGIAGLASGGTAQAALRFTSLTGNSQIDGVYVDPRMR